MSMVAFVTRFPELGARETRCLLVRGLKEIPDGDYCFLEFYCDRAGCDCRRVMIGVVREGNKDKFWATIGYGWESLKFYKRWGHLFSKQDALDCKGPYLDPLNPQSRYAPALLAHFRLFLESPDYVERLKRHYQMFRNPVDVKDLVERSRRPRDLRI